MITLHSAVMAASDTVKRRWPYFLIVIAVFFVYFRALFFNYTWLDDNTLILDNSHFLRNFSNIGQAFLREVFFEHEGTGHYRPIFTLSLMFDAQIGGTAPFMYHCTNLLLHMAAACLVFLFLTTFGVRRYAAFVLSIVFAVHPVLAQAVAWIPGRNEPLFAIFALSAMITLVRYWQNGEIRYLLGHCLFFALGLFTKETMAIFPLLSVFWICLTTRNKWAPPATMRQAFQEKLVRLLFVATSWILPGVLWLLLRRIAFANNPIRHTPAEIAANVWHNCPALLLDIGKIIIPVNLSVFPILQDSLLLYGVFALALLSFLFLFHFSPARESGYRTPEKSDNLCLPPFSLFLFGLLWFLFFLVPSFAPAHSGYPAVFLEHDVYVPLAGLLLMLSGIQFVKKTDFPTNTAWLAVGVVIYFLSLVAEYHLTAFSSGVAFWENAAKNSPHHAVSRKNLGAMYYLDGKMASAEQEYNNALALSPQEPLIHNNLGLIYKWRGDDLKAQEEYKKEIAVNPGCSLAYFNWGVLCYGAGKKKDAEALWLKSHELAPGYTDALKNLCSYYRENGDTAKARQFSTALMEQGVVW
jgi:tetratricopeptide (TPR) repeat protein